MVSIKDIAKKCGVSVATVSKALNNKHDISDETHDMICAAAEEMGYLRNSAAAALRTHHSYNIGVLFVDERQNGLKDEYFSEVLDGLRMEAEARGYDITFINRIVGKKPTSYLQHCRYRSLDGLVIACVNFFEEQVQELIASDIPLVTIDHVFDERISVISDNTAGMETLTDYIIHKGHRRLAYIYGEDIEVTRNRLAGFGKACRKAGIDTPAEYMIESVYVDIEGCYKATKQLLSLDERPTCIFFPDDYSAIGGVAAIKDAGLKIPEDISVVGYDGSKIAKLISPRLVTYRQDAEGLGREAARKLVRLIEHPKRAQIDSFIVSGHIVDGASVAEIFETRSPDGILNLRFKEFAV